MIERFAGTLLSPDDADYVTRALELLRELLCKQGSRPTPRLDSVTDQLRKAGVKSGVSALKAGTNARVVGPVADSGDDPLYALVDTGQAASILACSANNVRDLARRGTLPARRAGGRWVYDAQAVLARAERRR